MVELRIILHIEIRFEHSRNVLLQWINGKHRHLVGNSGHLIHCRIYVISYLCTSLMTPKETSHFLETSRAKQTFVYTCLRFLFFFASLCSSDLSVCDKSAREVKFPSFPPFSSLNFRSVLKNHPQMALISNYVWKLKTQTTITITLKACLVWPTFSFK